MQDFTDPSYDKEIRSKESEQHRKGKEKEERRGREEPFYEHREAIEDNRI